MGFIFQSQYPGHNSTVIAPIIDIRTSQPETTASVNLNSSKLQFYMRGLYTNTGGSKFIRNL